jgi:hypothetical protein
MRLMPKSRVAKIWGRQRAWCSQQSKPDKPLHGAIVDGQVDVESRVYRDYCESQGVAHTHDDRLVAVETRSGAAPYQATTRSGGAEFDDGTPDAMTRIMDLRLRDLTNVFGDHESLSAWLGDVKRVEDIREKRLKNQITEGSVVSREGVEKNVFGLLEELSRRLLQDAAKTITQQLYANAKSGVDHEKSRKQVVDIMSKNMRRARDGVTRNLKKL